MHKNKTLKTEDHSTIEAELHIPGLIIQVGFYDWDPSTEAVQCLRDLTLALLLSPRHRYSQGRYASSDDSASFTDIGDMLLVPPGIPFHARASGGPIRFVRCRYEPGRFKALTGLGDDWPAETLKACMNIKDARVHEGMMRLAHEVLAPGFGVEALAEGIGATLAVDLARHILSLDPRSKIAAGGLAAWQLRRILGYIDSHPGLTGNMMELAALCGISGRHLRRLFKHTTKQTLHSYWRDAWIAKAKPMLCDTELPLKEIASLLGFNDAGSFSTAFRRATGAAPRIFRQQFAKGGLEPSG